MSIVSDYANVFELEFRLRRRGRRVVARLVWAGLFLVRPNLALQIWRERRR